MVLGRICIYLASIINSILEDNNGYEISVGIAGNQDDDIISGVVTISYSNHASPLERSIKQFLMFNEKTYTKQKELTINILRILNNGSEIQ